MAVAKLEDIWTQVVTILKNAQAGSGSLNYVKEIAEGVREDFANFPIIYLEPQTCTEDRYSIPNHIRIKLNILIYIVLDVYGITKQIIGDTTAQGIMDIEKDIKNTLEAYPDLNGKALKFQFLTTNYSIVSYPYREAEITMEVEFVTLRTSR